MKWTEKEYIGIHYTQWSFVCETFIFTVQMYKSLDVLCHDIKCVFY